MTSKASDVAAKPDIFERVEPGARKAHKRHILRCALSCFSEAGIDAATIGAIRRRAGSSTGSIYHHFGSKEGLIAALFFIALDDQSNVMGPRLAAAPDVRLAVDALVRTYMEWVTAQPELARFMLRARTTVADGPFADKLAQRNRGRFSTLMKLLSDGVEACEVRALPRETYAPLLIGPAESYCRVWLSGRAEPSPADCADTFVAAAWRSLAL